MQQVDAEQQLRFKAAFGKLPWTQREIFILHRLHGLTYAEIGCLMGLSEATIERQMAKAISKLIKQMNGDKLNLRERWF